MKALKIRGAARIALLYAVAGSLWILLTDRLIAGLISNPERLSWFQTYKGWGFVLITAILLFVERRWSEAALRTSQARFSSVLQAVPSVILWLSPKGEILEFNPEAERIYGRRREDVLGQNYFDLFLTEEVREAVKQDQERVLAGKPTRGFENPVKAANGEERILIWNAAPLFDDRGQPLGTIAVGHDITERKRTKQALEESEARYRELIDNMKSGVAVYEARDNGQDFIFKDFNKSAEKIDMIEKEAVLGKSVLELFPGVVEFGLFDAFQRVWATGQPERHPISFYRDKRVVGWRENYVYKLPSGEIVSVYDDISQRKQTERRLQYQADLLQNVSDAIIATNLNFTIQSWNKAAEQIYGWTAAEAMGQNMADLVPTRYPDSNREEALAQLRQEGSWQGEVIQTRKGGTPVNIFASISLLKDEVGNPTGTVAVNRDITERKQTEESLRESEKRFRLAIDHFPYTFVIYDAERRFEFINERGIQLSDYSEEDMLGHRDEELFPPEVTETYLPLLKRAVTSRTPQSGECTMTLPATGTITSIINYIPLLDEQGQIRQILSITHDITERKRAERELEFRSTLLDAVGEAVIATNLAGEITFWNRAAEEVYGWQRTEVLGRSVLEVTPSEEMADAAAEIMEQLRQGHRWQGEFWLKRKDGQRFPALVTNAPLYDNTDTLCGIVGVSRDITERKRIEEALRQSERKYRNLVETAHDLIWAIDAEGHITFINQAARRIYGREPEEMIGRLYTDFIPPEEMGNQARSWELAQKSDDRIVGFENVVLHKDGTPIILNANVILLRDEEGNVVGSMGTSQDITERKQAEETLQHYARQLETVHRLGLELAAELDLKTLLQSIVSAAIGLIDGDAGGLYLYRSEQEVLEWAVAVGSDLTPIGSVLQRGEGVSGRVWETGQPLIIDDYMSWEGHASVYEGYSWRSLVGVPVHWGDEFLGVLDILDTRRGAFSPADAELLSQLATQAAIAIHNARLFEAEQQARQVAETLQEATVALASTLELRQVLDNILDNLERVVAYDSGAVMLIEGEYLHIVAGRGYPPTVEVAGYRFPLKDAFLTKIGQPDQSAYLDDIRNELRFLTNQTDLNYIRGWLCVPLRARGQTIGYLTLDSRQVGAYGESELELAQAFANQAAIAIHNARLFESERQQRLHAEILSQVTTTLATKTETEAVLDEILNQVKRIVPYQTANIALLEGNLLRTARWQGYSELDSKEMIANLEQPLDDFPLDRQIIRSGQPLVIPDTRQDPRWVALDQTAWIRSYLGLPIRLGERVLGQLRLDSPTPGEFSMEDAERLRPLADAAAIALENARLLEAERAAQEQLRNLADYLQAAREEERAEIAREVHDEFGQALTALKMDIAWLAKRLPPEETRLVEKTKVMSTLVDDSMHMVRHIAAELRPGMLDDLGLLATIEWQAQEFSERTGIACKLNLTEQDLELERDLATALFRIFQESLTNIMRHAEATEVRVTLECNSEELKLVVRDNGRGITKYQTHNPTSLGLLGIQERARAWGGQVTFRGRRGQGTTVTISIPQPADKEAQDD